MIFQGQPCNLPLTPLQALQHWPAETPVILLHSGRLDPRWARYSILARPLATYRFTLTPDNRYRSQFLIPESTAHLIPDHLKNLDSQFTHKPFHDLRLLTNSSPSDPALWIGYFSYDIRRWIEKLPLRDTPADNPWPIIELAYCPDHLVYDHQHQSWQSLGQWQSFPPTSLADFPPLTARYHAHSLSSVFSKDQYLDAVTRVKQYIAAGDIFQANLTQRLSAQYSGSPYPLAQRAIFQSLNSISPAWYGCYLELYPSPHNQSRRAIISTSPELFLELNPDRRVITRPIKGTRPASVPASELLHSEKDTAELNMIVDLMRNDLGRVCSYSTVRVDQPRTIETHPTIHHGVATISGTLHPRYDFVDLLHATLPGGSITGAPKIRAMQIIDELEPVSRGPYTGCIGAFNNQSATLNIAIRTILAQSDPTSADHTTGQLHFSVGGGIVADSDPLEEYNETLDKAHAILKTLDLLNQPVLHHQP